MAIAGMLLPVSLALQAQSLNSVAVALGGGTYVTPEGNLAGTSYLMQGGAYTNVGSALGAVDSILTTFDTRLASIEQIFNGGGGVVAGAGRIQVGGAADGSDVAQIGSGTNAIAIGSNATANADNGTAVGANAYAHGPNDTALGANARVNADGSTAVGANALISAEATNAVAVGADSSVTAASGTAIGQGASVTAEGAVAIGQGSVADRANAVSFGRSGEERALTNVADGTAATDAVNVGQMQEADRTTLASAQSYTDTRMAAWSDDFSAYKRDTDRRFHNMDRRMDRQGAMSAAMLNMATSAAGINTPNRVGVGVGFQGGENALSIGYQRAISERAAVTIGGAFSGDEKSVGVGAGFGW